MQYTSICLEKVIGKGIYVYMGMDKETLWNNKLIKVCVVFAGVWFFFRYLFTLVAPFVLAFLLITLCYPLLERIQRRIPVK